MDEQKQHIEAAMLVIRDAVDVFESNENQDFLLVADNLMDAYNALRDALEVYRIVTEDEYA